MIASLADGMSGHEIREAYPQLSEKDLLGALAYAAELMTREVLLPLGTSLRSHVL